MKMFLLTLSEYNRIHQVARRVIEGLGTAERSCIFFTVLGAYILETRYLETRYKIRRRQSLVISPSTSATNQRSPFLVAMKAAGSSQIPTASIVGPDRNPHHRLRDRDLPGVFRGHNGRHGHPA